MNEEAIVREIVNECLDPEGFLVKLRTHNTLDKKTFQWLLAELKAYSHSIADRQTINRSLAGCLFAIQEALDNYVQTLDKRYIDVQEYQYAQNAFAEVYETTLDIFRIP
ncbi:MAG: hypothetical protein HC876_20530 [Chloroflexaceae bacterium]|nr:hypothetical protein [Chloroflexaceae bacterium]